MGPPGPIYPSLGEALAWLDRHINLEAIEQGTAGRASLPTLERIGVLLHAMGDPERSYPIVHITGTNGKGSTTKLTSGLLRSNGLTVGSITSPHLEVLNERISIDGELISDLDLLETLNALAELESFLMARDGQDIRPTWFELMTAAGYRHFADAPVDAAVIEVGLGGRFDATNAGDGTVAVITNVELDHTEILGPTRRDIASEKAGIIKQGAHVVIGEQDDEIVAIFAEEARRVGARVLLRLGVEFDCVSSTLAHGGRVLDLVTPTARYDEVFVPLFGAHQGVNVAVALCAAESFFGEPLADEVVREALSLVTVPGRLEIVSRRPLVVLDGAHNPAGARALGAALVEDFAAIKRIVLVMGCLRRRDPGELLDEMGTELIEMVLACTPASPRAQSAENVKLAAVERGIAARVVDDVAEALESAIENSDPEDLVLVTGSLYVVGAARTAMRRLGSLRS